MRRQEISLQHVLSFRVQIRFYIDLICFDWHHTFTTGLDNYQVNFSARQCEQGALQIFQGST